MVGIILLGLVRVVRSVLYGKNSRRSVFKIWLPKICLDKDKLVQNLDLRNTKIAMDDMVVVKEVSPSL